MSMYNSAIDAFSHSNFLSALFNFFKNLQIIIIPSILNNCEKLNNPLTELLNQKICQKVEIDIQINPQYLLRL